MTIPTTKQSVPPSLLSEAIVSNLLINKKVPNIVDADFLNPLCSVFQSPNDELRKAKEVLLLHASNSNDWNDIMETFLNIDDLALSTPPDNIEFAKCNKALENDQVKQALSETVSKVIKRSVEYTSLPLDITWLSGIDDLWGFASSDRIYLNSQLLSNYVNRGPIDDVLSTNLKKIRYISCIIHETAHRLIRTETGDINSSTPMGDSIEEAGFNAERLVFGLPVNWRRTNIPKEKLEKLLICLETNQQVPKFPGLSLPQRKCLSSFCVERSMPDKEI